MIDAVRIFYERNVRLENSADMRCDSLYDLTHEERERLSLELGLACTVQFVSVTIESIDE